MTTLVLVFALLAQPKRLGAAADRADARLAARVAGCYALVPGPWSRDILLGQPYPADRPTRFHLTAKPFVVTRGERVWLARPERRAFRAGAESDAGSPVDTAGEAASRGWQYWQRAHPRSDSVVVTRVYPGTGVDLTLAPTGRDLAGRIEMYTDVRYPGRPYHVIRPVSARRVACAPAA